MTISDTDLVQLTEKLTALLPKVLVDEAFPYSSADHVVTDNYIVKVFVELEKTTEQIASIRIVLKEKNNGNQA